MIHRYATFDGFVGMRLWVPVLEKLQPQQMDWSQSKDPSDDLPDLADRLRLRLGEQAVMQAQLVESHVPEKQWMAVDPLARAHASAGQADPDESEVAQAFRPLHLLSRPVEVPVMVSPSEDRDGRPIMLVHQGRPLRVVHAAGPERIAGQWWDGHDKTRDYFDVEDPAGRRLWIFRVRQTGKWYLHGIFE
jgi:protein ImuB